MLKQVTITQLVLNCMGPATCGPFVRVAFVGTLGKCMMGLITFGLDFLADRDIISSVGNVYQPTHADSGAGNGQRKERSNRGREPYGVLCPGCSFFVPACRTYERMV